MIHSERYVIAIEDSTMACHYNNTETITKGSGSHAKSIQKVIDEHGKTVSLPFLSAKAYQQTRVEPIRVRVKDLVRGLQAMATSQLAWLEDLGDDPILLTPDFYEVFLACQQVRRAS